MSETGNYIAVDDILFKAAAFAGDKTFDVLPKGFYIQLVSDAFEELNISSKMLNEHTDFNLQDVTDRMSIQLPQDCFNVCNVYMYFGDKCNIGNSQKVWPKRNFYSNGKGYLANRTGHNHHDPFYRNLGDHVDKTLFYNVQNGNLMLSSSCRTAGNKIHLHYNGTGCDVTLAPIIPIFYREAITDYVTEGALRARMADEKAEIRKWMPLYQLTSNKLGKESYSGSWPTAIKRAKTMSDDQRISQAVYAEKAAWATGR